jgi:hypothetical protein
MANKRYDLSNKKDLDEVMSILLGDDSSDTDSDDETDDDILDNLSERSDDSETEQSGVDSGDDTTDNSEYFIAHKKVKGKVESSWEWRKAPLTQKRKRAKQNILIHLPGTRGSAKNCEKVFDCWNCLIDDSMLINIVACTNEYIATIQDKYSRERDSRFTDVIEIKAFFGLLYLAGVYRASRLNLKELWDTQGNGIEKFRLVMGLKRFMFLKRCLRFDSKCSRAERRKVDKLAAIREVFQQFVENCKKSYCLGENCTIDEMLVGFRGKCPFRQYIPSKPNKYGIKVFCLTDARMLYTYNMEIYPGLQPDGPYLASTKPADVVKRLISPIKGSGRNITLDNWFTSFELLTDLRQDRLSLVGTVRKNKAFVPAELKTTKNREVTSSLFGFRREGTLVSYVPKKGRNVIVVSSMHFDKTIDEQTGDKQKPDIITFYNQTKGGVDAVDKMCETYSVSRKTQRWPLTVFFGILNVAGINAQILFMSNGNSIRSRRNFLRQLSNDLTYEHIKRRSESKYGLPQSIQEGIKSVTDSQENRSQNDGEQDNEFRSETRKRCVTCVNDKRTRLSKYNCLKCKNYLCLQHASFVCPSCSKKL